MTHLAQGLGLDLTDTLTGDLELFAHLLESAGVSINKSEALFKNLTLALGEGVENILDLLLEENDGGHVGGIFSRLVLDEVTEAGVVAVTHGGLKRDRLLSHLENGLHASHGKLDLVGDLLSRGFATVLLHKLLLDADQLVDRLDHMHRDTDGAGLIGDGAGDGLTNPPSGVGRELVAAAVLKLLDGLHKTHVSLLDQVEERESAVGVLLGDRDDEAEVGLDHLCLGAKGQSEMLLEIAVAVVELVDAHPVLAMGLMNLRGKVLDVADVLGLLTLLCRVLLVLGLQRVKRLEVVVRMGDEILHDLRLEVELGIDLHDLIDLLLKDGLILRSCLLCRRDLLDVVVRNRVGEALELLAKAWKKLQIALAALDLLVLDDAVEALT